MRRGTISKTNTRPQTGMKRCRPTGIMKGYNIIHYMEETPGINQSTFFIRSFVTVCFFAAVANHQKNCVTYFLAGYSVLATPLFMSLNLYY